MLSRNNFQQSTLKHINKRQRFSLRKLTIGVASVLLGTTFFMGVQGVVADADTATTQTDQTTEVSANAGLRNANKQVVLKSGNQGSAAASNATNSAAVIIAYAGNQSSQRIDQKSNEAGSNQTISKNNFTYRSTDNNSASVTPDQHKVSVKQTEAFKVSANALPLSTNELKQSEVQEQAPDVIFRGAINQDKSFNKTYKNGDKATLQFTIQNDKYIDESSQYLFLLPIGFDLDSFSQDSNSKNAGFVFSDESLGKIGPNGESAYLINLNKTPYWGIPVILTASLTCTGGKGSAGGHHVINSEPLFYALNKNGIFGESHQLRLGNQRYQIANVSPLLYGGNYGNPLDYTIEVTGKWLSNSDFKVTDYEATSNNVNDSHYVGNEQLVLNLQLDDNVSDGDYIDVHLGIPYLNNGQLAYELYDTKLSDQPLEVKDGNQVIAHAYNMGTYYRIVFNQNVANLSNPNVQVTLQWGSNRDASRFNNNHSSINDGTNYVYQTTDDINKDRTTFTYSPKDDIDVNGLKLTSGYQVTGTYIYTAKQAGIGNLKTGASSIGSYNRIWDSKGHVNVDTSWYNNTAVILSTKDLGDEFDIQTTVTKDPTGLVHYSFTSAADMQKQLTKEIAPLNGRSLIDQVTVDPATFIGFKTTKGIQPKVQVEVTFHEIDNKTQRTGKWHIKLINLDPKTNPDIQFKEKSSVTTVSATASDFTMPSEIKSYAQDQANVVNTDTYSGAKTDNEALMNVLKSLPIAGTIFTPYQNGKAGISSGVYGGKWSAGILYSANGSVSGGGSASDLVTNTLSFEDVTTKQKIGNDVTFQGVTGTKIQFAGAQNAFNGLSGYKFVKAVSVGKDGTETVLNNFDPRKIDSYSFGNANKNNPVSYIIYLQKQDVVKQSAKLTYVDDDDKSSTKMPASVDVRGLAKTSITFSGISDNITKLLSEHYLFNGVTRNSDNSNISGKNIANIDWNTIFGTFDDVNDTTQGFTIHFKHATETTSRDKQVTETVHYVMADGTKAPADNVQSVKFTEKGTKDLVTQKIQWEPANSQSFSKVVVPNIKGYSSNVSFIPATTVKYDSDNITKTVTYTPESQQLTVQFIDDTTGNILKTVTKNGNSNVDSKYNTQNDIKGYEGQHFILVSDSTNGQELIFDHDSKVDQSYQVHFKHATRATTRNKQVTETVHYVMADGTKAPADNVQTLKFNENGTLDLVTGNTTWNSAKSQSFAKVDSPTVKGYTPDYQFIAEVDNINFDSQNVIQTVTYKPTAEKLNVKFIDDTTGKVLKIITKDGFTNTSSKYNTKTDIQTYQSQHYVLVSDSTDGQYLIFDNDPSSDQSYEVHLKHDITETSESHVVKETIHYIFNNGLKAHDDSVQTLSFIQTGMTDLVTGSTVWSPAVSQSFREVISPVIDGYTADRISVPSQQVNYDSSDLNFTVTYTANSKPVTPVNPSKPSQPTAPSQPSQPSRPSQPTKPTTPSQPSQPSRPSQPTKPSTPSQPSQPLNIPSSGKSDDPQNNQEPGTPQQPSSKTENDVTPSQPVQQPSVVKQADVTIKTPTVKEVQAGFSSHITGVQSKEQTQSQARLPQTGNQRASEFLVGAGFIAGLSALFLGKKRKKN